MSPAERAEAAERGRARAAEVCRGCRPVVAADDLAKREERARRRVEARLRFAARGLFDRPDTTWEGAGLPAAEPAASLPLRRLSG